MAIKWIQTKYTGVRFWEHENRRYGLRKDRYYSIRYMGWKPELEDDGKPSGKLVWIQIEDGLGWESELSRESKKAKGVTWSELDAVHERKQKIIANKSGEGDRSNKAKKENTKKKLEAEELDRIKLERENITFGSYFKETYLPAAKTHKKKQTYKKEELHFNLWISPIIGNKPFKSIVPLDIERLKKMMIDIGRSPRTVQYVLATTRQVWNMARRDGIIMADSPTRSVKILKFDNQRKRFLTMDEEINLLKKLKAKSILVHNIVLLSLRTGMRASEIFDLKWNCVNLDKKIIMIMDSKWEKSRVAFMTDDIKEMFETMTKGKQTEYVFKSTKGGRINEISDTFSDSVKELKLNDDATDRRHKICFHSCRHTFASRLAESGVDLYTIKTLMGHSTIALTERYSHLSNVTLQNAMMVLNDTNKKVMSA